MKRKSASRPRGDDSRRHTSTAENVEMGPIQKRKKKTTNDTKSEVSSSTAALLVSNESNSSSGSSSGRWYNSTRSDTSSTRIICKDDHMRIHESRFSPSKFLSISLNPLPPPQSTTYNFTASSSTFSVVMSCNASPLPDRPMGTTLGFLQGLPTTADSLNKFISIVDKNGYGELDLIHYSKDGRPFVNRLSLSPAKNAASEVTHYLAMIQSFDNNSAAAAITATTSGSTNSQNLHSGSEQPFSSSNEDSTDTSSSSSREKKREKSNNSASSNSSAIDDTDVTKLLSKIEPTSTSSDLDSSSSDGIEVGDGDIASYLANNSDGGSVDSVNSDDASHGKKGMATSSSKIDSAATTASTKYPLAAKFIAARVDLETARRAAYATAMGHNTGVLFSNRKQSTSSSGAAAGDASSTVSVTQTPSNSSSMTPPPSSPSPTSTPALPASSTTAMTTTTTTKTTTTTTTTTMKTTTTKTATAVAPAATATPQMADGDAVTWGAEIVSNLSSGIDAFLNFSRGAGAKYSLCLINSKGKIVHVNSSFVNLTGYRLEECEQKTIKDILWGPATDASSYQELWRQVSNNCVSNSCILVSYQKTGEGFLTKVGLYGVGEEYYCLYMEEVEVKTAEAAELEQRLTESANGNIIKIHLCHPLGDRTMNCGQKGGGGQLAHLVEQERSGRMSS